jgi:hypothetical protein
MEIIYPENSSQIIEDIIEKYGFSEAEKESFEKLTHSTTKEDYKEISKNSAGFKLAELVIRRANGLLSPDKLPLAIKEEMGTTDKTARQIAAEFEEKILPFIEIQKTPSADSPAIKFGKETLVIKGEQTPHADQSEEIKKSDSKPDNYRENIE